MTNLFQSLEEKVHYESFRNLILKLVEEGKRVGKCPWCADGDAEVAASEILSKFGIMGIETMGETCKRREEK